jgi:hypothetical protein
VQQHAFRLLEEKNTMCRFISFIRSLLWFGIVASSAVAVAQTSPTTQMQIDGNAANDNLTCEYGTPCDYWNLLNGTQTGGNVGSAGHSLVRTFLNGTASTDSYTGGGSKEPE